MGAVEHRRFVPKEKRSKGTVGGTAQHGKGWMGMHMACADAHMGRPDVVLVQEIITLCKHAAESVLLACSAACCEPLVFLTTASSEFRDNFQRRCMFATLAGAW